MENHHERVGSPVVDKIVRDVKRRRASVAAEHGRAVCGW
jgi:hypothetical protein